MTSDLARWATRLVAVTPRRAAGHGHLYPPELAGAVEAALDHAERCRRCGRRLTDPDSVARKIGPDCLVWAASEATSRPQLPMSAPPEEA